MDEESAELRDTFEDILESVSDQEYKTNEQLSDLSRIIKAKLGIEQSSWLLAEQEDEIE